MAPVYLDNAATTRVDDAVARAMVEAMTVDYGNPSSAHRMGVAAQKRLDAARAQVARAIGADGDAVYFTSGGTEANALGTLGVAANAREPRRHAVYSSLEHPSVVEPLRRLAAERGFTLTEVKPEKNGVVTVAALAGAVRDDTALVALMLVSNELGTVQPIAEAARAVKAKAPRAHFHVDAVQALGKVAIDVAALGIDSLSVSAHKIHGPKGAGALWLRKGARVTSLTVGGGQERGVRPGTEGVPGAIGLGLAAELAEGARGEAMARLAELRARMIERARALVPWASAKRGIFPSLMVHGAEGAAQAAHIVSLGFRGAPAEPLLHALEARGIFVSAGSACAAKDKKPSAALVAIGVPQDVGTIRISFARTSTVAEVDAAALALAEALAEVGVVIHTSPTGTPSGDVILCRYAEIFLKGGNRGFFERKLLDNMRRAVAPVLARVEKLHGRVLIRPPPGGSARTVARLERVFGLASLSPARLVEKSLAAISAAAVEEARAFATSTGNPPSGLTPRGQAHATFKVETRRADKRFQPASPEVSRLVGGAVVEGVGLGVDVHTPQLTIGVEIGFEHAFVWGRTVAGPGGLPVGSSGRVDLLLSGGIDSPVAGWMAMKRGCQIAATYFHSFPYTGDKTKEKVAGLARLLARWQGPLELRVVPFTDAQKALRAAGDPRLAVVLYRRMMLRVAEQLARARGAQALVTGDALGQVASQTLENLAVIGAATTLPILRPLVAHDKQETIGWARRIGTYDLSIAPYEDCCSLFVPDHPETKARLAPVEAAEAKLDLAALTAACVDGVETIVCQEG